MDRSSEEIIHEASSLLQGVLGEEAELYEFQETAVANVVQDISTLLVCRTGGGKSATYFLATKIRRRIDPRLGPCLVVSPLVALMNDQVRAAKGFGLQAAAVNSNTAKEVKGAVLKAIRKNKLDMLFLTPEMISGGSLLGQIQQFSPSFKPKPAFSWCKVAMIVLDEVHCVSDWGHNFRPAYYEGLQEVFKGHWAQNTVKLATSATVPPRVESDIKRLLHKEHWTIVRGALMRPNLHIRPVLNLSNIEDQIVWVQKYREANPNENVLVFARSKNDVRRFSSACGGVEYTADLDGGERTKIEHDFVTGKISFVCSTIALSMGLDKRDLHTVIIAYTPATVSSFYQMIGRAGRGIDEGKAFVFHKKPWSSDFGREKAIAEALRAIRQIGSLTADLLFIILESRNVKRGLATAAIDYLLQRGCAERVDGKETFVAVLCANQRKVADEAVKARGDELKFMTEIMKTGRSAGCVWATLLMFLGDAEAASGGWTCKTLCSNCHPEAIDDQLVQSSDYCYVHSVPCASRDVPVYAFSLNAGDRFVDSDDLRDVLIGKDMLVKQPYKWVIAFIPGGEGGRNEELARVLASDLAVEVTSFVTPVKTALKLTLANTPPVRKERLERKFPPSSFDHGAIDRIVESGRNVLVFDDSVKSGSTLAHVLGPLLEKLSAEADPNDHVKVAAVAHHLWLTAEQSAHVEKIRL